jgi:O-antigen/teichoic acid export membrane protein
LRRADGAGLSVVSDAKKNAFSYYLNTMVTAAVGLVVNPLLLNALGTVEFGAWKTIQRVLDVGSAANGGAMQSLKWVIAHRSKNADDAAKRRDVGAALTVLLRWSPVLLAVTALIVILLPAMMRDVPREDVGMIYVTGGILGLNVVLLTLAAVPDAVLMGTNQGFRSMNVTTVVMVGTNAAMVGAAVLGWGLQGVAVTIALGTGVNGLLTFLVLRRRVAWWGLAKPTRDDVSRLSKFSGWVLAWTFVNRLALATEVIVLSVLAGVALISSYAFTSYVAAFASSVCLLTTSSLMPRLGAYIGNGEWQRAQVVAREARELTLGLATGIGSLIIILNGSFVKIWAGEEQFMGQGVNVLMVIAFIQFAVIRTDAQIQDTGLDIGKKVILGAVMTVGAIVSGAVAFAASGSVEIMYVAICATRLIGTVGFPVLANRVIRGSTWPGGRSAVAVVILATSVAAANFADPKGLLQLIALGTLATLLLAPLVFYTTLSASTRRKVLSR